MKARPKRLRGRHPLKVAAPFEEISVRYAEPHCKAPGGQWGGVELGKPQFRVEHFMGLKPTDKLVWFFIRDFPGSYSRASLGKCLDLSPIAAYHALQTLLGRGLLEETQPSSGRRPAQFRAILPSQPPINP